MIDIDYRPTHWTDEVGRSLMNHVIEEKRSFGFSDMVITSFTIDRRDPLDHWVDVTIRGDGWFSPVRVYRAARPPGETRYTLPARYHQAVAYRVSFERPW